MFESSNDEMRAAQPSSVFNAYEKKPSDKVVENLRQWRDQEAESELKKEEVDAVLELVKNEVKQ